MPDCPRCHTLVPGDARLCPHCGAPLDPGRDGGEQSVHSVLLNAHLLKLRGELEEATAECIRALRIDPDSVAAHSLLGDIYKEQGKDEEAMNWYKLALDLKPDSRVDRARLERLLAGKKPTAAQPPAAPRGKTPLPTKPVVLIAAVLLSLIAIALFIGNWWPVLVPPSAGTGQAPEPAPAPTVMMPKRPENPATTEPPAPTVSVTAESYQEQATMTALNDTQAIRAADIKIVGLLQDARNDSVTLTFAGPALKGENPAEEIVKNSLIVARQAFLQDIGFSRVTVRAVYTMPAAVEPRAEVVFIGDISRSKAVSLSPETSTHVDRLAAFDQVWWYPKLETTSTSAAPHRKSAI